MPMPHPHATPNSMPNDPPPPSPSPPAVIVTCSHLTYSITLSRRKHQTISLVRNISIYLAPGLTAILGPSGCGKTTLLDCLAGRKEHGEYDKATQILYDGTPPTPDYLRQKVGYVEQQDTLLSMLTPFEMLLYTSELKNPRNVPRNEKRDQVSTLIDQLGLSECQGTVIGSLASRGISGGEAKRVNIGIALIVNPLVLYIDELTSGLDSFTGHEVSLIVSTLAKERNMTVCVSIHSPPPYTFDLFQRICILQRGRVVYFGNNGEEAIEYVHKMLPSLRSVRKNEGVADYLIDVTTRVNKVVEEAAKLADTYEASDLYKENSAVETELLAQRQSQQQHLRTFSSRRRRLHKNNDIANGDTAGVDVESQKQQQQRKEIKSSTAAVPFWWSLYILFSYRSRKAYFQPTFIMPRSGDKIMIVFLIVTIWWSVGNNTDSSVAVAGVLFLWSMLSAFTSMGILPTIVLERPVYRRERADGLYTPWVYCVYKITEELAPQVPIGAIYSALVFYLVRLQGSFVLFWLVYLVATANAIAMTSLFSALSPNTSAAGAILSSYATTLFFFSGYLIPFNKLPEYWVWASVIDPLRYAFGAMMVNQFGSGGGGNDTTSIAEGTLEFYDLQGVDAWRWLGYQAIFFPVYFLMMWAAMQWLHYVKR